MQKWKEIYQSKLTTVDEAVKAISSGDRVVLAHACGEPQALTQAMFARAPELHDVEIVHQVAMGGCPYCRPGMEKHFWHNSIFVGATSRLAIKEGRGDYTPCFNYEIPRLFTQGFLPVDVAMVQVSSPDEHGCCSFGISVDWTITAAKYARITIAQVNRNMPRTLGETFMHISEFDHIVEVDEPLIEMTPPQIGSVEENIGRYCAELIEDGSTLQLGIGAIPDGVLMFLQEKRDLGIHTEMFADGVVELFEAGVVTNQAKTLHKGKLVATFLMGTEKLYRFVDNNPQVAMFPIEYANDPFVISQNHRMVSINSALQVDLNGQVCAETIGYTQYSGVGGQVDFVRGCSRAPGGKSIIALPATAAGGKISRIVAVPDEGAAVTTSRNDVHYVVTEYGIANLRGKTLRQRARELIAVAHPDFRKDLEKAMQDRNW